MIRRFIQPCGFVGAYVESKLMDYRIRTDVLRRQRHSPISTVLKMIMEVLERNFNSAANAVRSLLLSNEYSSHMYLSTCNPQHVLTQPTECSQVGCESPSARKRLSHTAAVQFSATFVLFMCRRQGKYRSISIQDTVQQGVKSLDLRGGR